MIEYLQNPSNEAKFKLKQKALKYTMVKYCGSHKSGPTMRWLIVQHEYYWLTITADCYRYTKECEECQK